MALRMFPTWRHRWQQAQAALTAGNLEEAAAHLAAIDATACGAGTRLAAEVAEQLARRALQRAADGALPLALDDLRHAQALGGRTPLWQQLARAVVEATLQRAIRAWTEGNAQAPQEALATLAQARDLELKLTELAEVARRLELAHALARRGKFLEARRQLAAVQVIAPHALSLAEAAQRYQQQAESLAPLVEQLRSALAAEEWSAVLESSQALLAVAAEHPTALAARQRAWAALGICSQAEGHEEGTAAWVPHPRDVLDAHGAAEPPPGNAPSSDRSFQQPLVRPGSLNHPTRLVLWVDGVGSYLMLLSDKVTIGPASFRASVDLPMQADLSRRHARIVRRDEEYWLEPIRGRVCYAGDLLTEPRLLADGQELLLGDRVRLRFRRPHPLSCTARLERLSSHRTVPLADAVLLMAHTCILGSDGRSHVVCPESTAPIYITHENRGILKCHSKERIEVDGQTWDASLPLRLPARVTGAGISFLLEQA
jgi:tetratricopeptide (TPR) repeat protein